MKNVFLLFGCLLCALAALAQAPQGINYQAIARDAAGNPKTSVNNIAFRIQDAFGMAFYSEVHANPTVNQFGLFNLTIGKGTSPQGVFANIPWASGPKYLVVSVDGNAGPPQEMQSVPYALYAEKTNLQAGNGISVSGNTISNQGDLSNTNEIQTLSISGNQLSILGGNSVTLPTPNIQLSNITDDMPTSFTTTVRGAAWQTMESKLQAQAPSAGTYLILYTLRATNFTDNDVVFFKVSNAITGGDYASSVLMSANNGFGDVSSSSFCIANLSQGEVVQVREKMEGSGTTTVMFQDGRLTLIKIQ